MNASPNVAFRRGPWRDLWVTLHWPRAACYYSFALWGLLLAPVVHWDRVGWALLAAFLYLQVAAYAADEVRGRHCGTAFSNRALHLRVVAGMVPAIGIGLYLSATVSWWLLLFLGAGLMGALGYNYETLGQHQRHLFAWWWGAFPVVAHYVLQTIDLPGWPWGFGPDGWASGWSLHLLVLALAAAVFALLHIQTWGNVGCRVAYGGRPGCWDYQRDGVPEPDAPYWRAAHRRDCHGQRCSVRRLLGADEVARPVSHLQKRLAHYQTALVLVLTLALALWRFGF